MKKQGANNGASLSFLISTPESGVDSIALTYSLLDPIMTVLRPVVAFVTGFVAGIVENFTGRTYRENDSMTPDLSCPVDGCCDGKDCDPVEHARHHTFIEKLRTGMTFAFEDLMADIAKWFILGIFLAGAITYMVPESVFQDSIGSGLWAYLAMLAVSLPMYVCATMSTPIAAALVLKGLSPGAALVFLMAGPATNVATLTVVWGLLGKRTMAVYLSAIIVCTLVFAYITDGIYGGLGISAQATAGAAAEIFPEWLQWACAALLAVLCVRVAWYSWLRPAVSKFSTGNMVVDQDMTHETALSDCCDDARSSGET